MCRERYKQFQSETKIIPLNLFKRIFYCSNRSARDEKTKKKKKKKKKRGETVLTYRLAARLQRKILHGGDHSIFFCFAYLKAIFE